MIKKSLVFSLGGSLIVPDEIDSAFLLRFKKVIVENFSHYERIIIVTGGGAIARKYQQAANSVTSLEDEDMDWLGIHVTRLNAHLLRSIFRKWAHPKVITKPLKSYKISNKIIIGGGWKPGWSTDYVATLFAHKYGIKEIVNLSDINFVYDKDPHKFRDAKKQRFLKWSEFRQIVGNRWIPGANFPFDPIASKFADKKDMNVYILNGKKYKNLSNFIKNKPFIGTTISNQQEILTKV